MDINEFLATKVMGWEKDMLGQGRWIMSRSKDGGYIDKYILLSDWHPDTDLNQARNCLYKFTIYRACHVDINLYLEDDGRVAYTIDICACLVDDVKQVTLTDYEENKKLELAICEAIREAMEAKDE